MIAGPKDVIKKIVEAKYKKKSSSYSDLYGGDFAIGIAIIFFFCGFSYILSYKKSNTKIKSRLG